MDPHEVEKVDDENKLDVGVGGSGGDDGSSSEEENVKEKQQARRDENDKERQQEVGCSSSPKKKRPDLVEILAGILAHRPREALLTKGDRQDEQKQEGERARPLKEKDLDMDNDRQGKKEEDGDKLPKGIDLDIKKKMAMKKEQFACKLCGKQFADHRALGGHVASHSRKSTKQKEAVNSPDGKFKCDECLRCFSAERGLNVHRNKHCPVDKTLVASTSASPSTFSSTSPSLPSGKQVDDDDDKEEDDDRPPSPKSVYLFGVNPNKKDDDDDPPPRPNPVYLFGFNLAG